MNTLRMKLIAAATVIGCLAIFAPSWTPVAQAAPTPIASVSGGLHKGTLCTTASGSTKKKGSVTISAYGAPTSGLFEIILTGRLKKAAVHHPTLWQVYLRQVTNDGFIDELAGHVFTGKKGKGPVYEVEALAPGSYELQVLVTKGDNTGCPGTDPGSFKTGVLPLTVP